MARVLLVDDEPALLDVTKLSLEAMGGFCVTGLTDAKTALVAVKTTGYDAIVSDYDMPAGRVPAAGGHTPIIVFRDTRTLQWGDNTALPCVHEVI
jgi:CheY-like chemotaxis protein